MSNDIFSAENQALEALITAQVQKAADLLVIQAVRKFCDTQQDITCTAYLKEASTNLLIILDDMATTLASQLTYTTNVDFNDILSQRYAAEQCA